MCCIKQLWGPVPDLLKAGADPNVRLVSGSDVCTPTATCCSHHTGSHGVSDHAANVQTPTWGVTPLHVACEAGHLPTVRALVAAGARVNAFARFKTLGAFPIALQASPLACATRSGYADVVSFLMDSGADPNLGDDSVPVRAPACLLRSSHGVTGTLVMVVQKLQWPPRGSPPLSSSPAVCGPGCGVARRGCAARP